MACSKHMFKRDMDAECRRAHRVRNLDVTESKVFCVPKKQHSNSLLVDPLTHFLSGNICLQFGSNLEHYFNPFIPLWFLVLEFSHLTKCIFRILTKLRLVFLVILHEYHRLSSKKESVHSDLRCSLLFLIPGHESFQGSLPDFLSLLMHEQRKNSKKALQFSTYISFCKKALSKLQFF